MLIFLPGLVGIFNCKQLPIALAFLQTTGMQAITVPGNVNPASRLRVYAYCSMAAWRQKKLMF